MTACIFGGTFKILTNCSFKWSLTTRGQKYSVSGPPTRKSPSFELVVLHGHSYRQHVVTWLKSRFKKASITMFDAQFTYLNPVCVTVSVFHNTFRRLTRRGVKPTQPPTANTEICISVSNSVFFVLTRHLYVQCTTSSFKYDELNERDDFKQSTGPCVPSLLCVMEMINKQRIWQWFGVNRLISQPEVLVSNMWDLSRVMWVWLVNPAWNLFIYFCFW